MRRRRTTAIAAILRHGPTRQRRARTQGLLIPHHAAADIPRLVPIPHRVAMVEVEVTMAAVVEEAPTAVEEAPTVVVAAALTAAVAVDTAVAADTTNPVGMS